MFLLSQASGAMVYLAAIIFALGVTYFWPTMLGCVSEYTPQTGALGLSIIGGAGMFAVSIWNPIIGSWIDNAASQAQAQNLTAEQIQVLSGQAVLENLLIFPVILVAAFAILYFIIKQRSPISSSVGVKN
jgi:hypothetical protein